MSLSNDIYSYTDVRAVLNEALRQRGVVYRPQRGTRGAAVNWVLRFNKFRKLARRNGEAQYDILTVVRLQDDSIEIRYDNLFKGEVQSMEGYVIPPPGAEEHIDDALIAARAVRREMDDED